MARLEAPVMNTRRRAPAARASSTAYWIAGLSTTGSISFGMALVAGRKRVPRPAAGITALVMWYAMQQGYRSDFLRSVHVRGCEPPEEGTSGRVAGAAAQSHPVGASERHRRHH